MSMLPARETLAAASLETVRSFFMQNGPLHERESYCYPP